MKPKHKKRRQAQNVHLRGAQAIAAKLGVTRVTIWRVVNGKVHSPVLLARIRELISEQDPNSKKL